MKLIVKDIYTQKKFQALAFRFKILDFQWDMMVNTEI